MLFGAEKDIVIFGQVQELLQAGHIKEVQFPTWLSNMVLVPKATGKWRMCVVFQDLNKACPKDFILYPGLTSWWIPRLAVNFSASWMHTRGATYKRMMDRVFREQMGPNVEVYVDDILVKSRTRDCFISDLEENFSKIRQYEIKLNPAKCMFGVKSGKFLGIMVTERGIEVNPEKVKMLQEMPSPTSIREAQKFGWNDQCEQAFQELKVHLVSLTVLVKLEPGEGCNIWRVFVDGATGIGGSGVGVILILPTQEKIKVAVKLDFKASNIEAKYEAIIAGMKQAREVGATQIIIYSDSQLVVQQTKGKGEISSSSVPYDRRRFWNATTAEYYTKLLEKGMQKEMGMDMSVSDALTLVEARRQGFLRREPNNWHEFVAVRMLPSGHTSDVTKARASLVYCIVMGKSVDVGRVIQYSIIGSVKGSSNITGVVWNANEKQLLATQGPIALIATLGRDKQKSYTSANEQPSVVTKHLVMGFLLEYEGHVLSANLMILEITDFDYALVKKVVTLGNDDDKESLMQREFVATIETLDPVPREDTWMAPMVTYLSTGDLPAYEGASSGNMDTGTPICPSRPASNLKPVWASCPFDQWGLDIVGPFPQARAQKKFLLVAVDYFSKWVEAKPLEKITEGEVMKFLWKNIVCRFGLPRKLVSDNGRQFQGQKLADWCAEMGIKKAFTSMAYPQSNGQTEVLKGDRGRSQGAGIGLSRRTEGDGSSENGGLSSLGNESLQSKGQASRILRGVFILKKVNPAGEVGKLDALWEGPYKLIRKVGINTWYLEDNHGRMLKRPWNAVHLKKYFA
ncbi:uncharacterized protein [Henckelia pumila]|uniref:uncharacterized protein n=1 Tax=Henckelia pumila TaxID=405737 RepID=UPI003C6E6515